MDMNNFLPKDFYHKVEQPGVLKHILYGDTDSIIFKIPVKNADKMELSKLWDISSKTADVINKLIIDYTRDIILPRCNINPKYNQTFFKTELLMESLLILDVKKKYAYKLLIKEGNILNKPKINYTGIEVIKSNGIKLTQELLTVLIEDIALNVKISDEEKKQITLETINEFRNKFLQSIINYDFDFIGIPGKWSKDKQYINGMKLYNHIMNENIFEPGSSAKFIYIIPTTINNEFKNQEGICVPFSYNIEVLKEKFQIFNIRIDEKTHWSKLFNITCKRVIDIIKKDIT